jgi:hypothetical protein
LTVAEAGGAVAFEPPPSAGASEPDGEHAASAETRLEIAINRLVMVLMRERLPEQRR